MLPEHLAFLDTLLSYGVPEEQALQFLAQSGLVPAAPAAATAPVTAAVEPVVPGAGPPPQAPPPAPPPAPEPAAAPQAPAATAPAPTLPAAQPQQQPAGPGPGYRWPISGGAKGIADGLVQRGMQGAQAPMPKVYTGAPRPAMPPRPESTGPTRRVMPPGMLGPKGGW